MLRDLHEGIIGSHTAGRALANRAITQGVFWPGIRKQVEEYLRKSNACQRHRTRTLCQ
ncbi:hypothetical protein GIB67_016740 [Kingdonia uniflora]|uniref:Integrase zinc-binding domain-containing protein n=1 Tax=Kingdonia uniflora TaxID=39325 RepID=A0A7J7LMM8_9MAGN|nr:hypothetical protein GIB67_016740 [Kingdonia uniflora]